MLHPQKNSLFQILKSIFKDLSFWANIQLGDPWHYNSHTNSGLFLQSTKISAIYFQNLRLRNCNRVE